MDVSRDKYGTYFLCCLFRADLDHRHDATALCSVGPIVIHIFSVGEGEKYTLATNAPPGTQLRANCHDDMRKQATRHAQLAFGLTIVLSSAQTTNAHQNNPSLF